MKNNKIIKKSEINKEKSQNIIEKYKKITKNIKNNMQLKKEIGKLIDQWQEVMAETKTYNNMKLSLTLRHINKENYGWSSRIYSPYGIPLEKLETLSPYIESGIKCKFIYNIPEHKQFAICKIIYPELVKVNEILFEPILLKPQEFCPGLDVTGKPIIFDVNTASQILIAGQTRRGKNISCYVSIVSWIYYCNPKEITLYFFQGAKNDLSQFQDCEHIYCYTSKLNEMIIALKHIVEDEMKNRENLFAPMIREAEGNDNIFYYNKLHHSNIIPYIYVIIDEFIALMIDNSVDSKEIKNQKSIIMNYLQTIVQIGGSYGINLIAIHQKPCKDLMPSFLKNMCNIRICFGFEDETCVQIVLGSGLIKMAHKLPPRKAYYSNNDQNGYLYTPNMKGRIKMFIKQSINPNHRTLFSDLKKLKKNNLPSINSNQFNQSNQSNKSNNKSNDNSQSNNGSVPLPQTFNPKLNSKSNLNQTKINKSENISIETKETNKLDNSKPKSNNIPKIKPIITQDFSNVDANTILKKQETLRNNISKIPNFVPYIPSNKLKLKVIDQTNIPLLPSQKPIKNSKGDN